MWIEDYHQDIINLRYVSNIKIRDTDSKDEYKFAVYADTLENNFTLFKSSTEKECRDFVSDLLLKLNSSDIPKRRSQK